MEDKKWRIFEGDLYEGISRATLAAQRKKEIGGLLVDNGYFLEFAPLRNKSRKGGRASFYYSEIRGIEKASRKLGHRIVGTFQSLLPPRAEDGVGDIEGNIEGTLLLIISPTKRKAVLWETNDGKWERVEFVLLRGRD